MFTYMMVLNDFGIRPSAIWGLSGLKAPLPNETDIYDIDNNYINKDTGECVIVNGNTNVVDKNEDNHVTLGWDFTKPAKVDIRLFYSYEHQRKDDSWTSCRFGLNEDFPDFYKYSSVTESPICYSTEALKYAQAAYLVSIVTVQASGLISAKTRNLSLYQQGMVNGTSNFGLFSEFALVAFLLYVKGLNPALGTRQIPFPHFAVPSFSFYITIFFYDELRKIYLRRGMVKENG